MNNSQELTSKLSKETMALQKAIGEKLGVTVMTFTLSVAGLGIALYKGWSFSLVIVGCFPPMVISMSMMVTIMQKGFIGNTVAYS